MSLLRSRCAKATAPPDPSSLLSMANQSLDEGDSGSANMTFSLVRSGDGRRPIAFDYATSDGTASAGTDYTSTSGNGTIKSGETVQISVPILGDTDVESDETFTLRISNLRYT